MGADTHRPPSRVRYEQAHPTLSCRLDPQTHELLKRRLASNGLSFADFVKSQLGVMESNTVNVREAEEKAYSRAKKEYGDRLAAAKAENAALKESMQRLAENVAARVRAYYMPKIHCGTCGRELEFTAEDVVEMVARLGVRCPYCSR